MKQALSESAGPQGWLAQQQHHEVHSKTRHQMGVLHNRSANIPQHRRIRLVLSVVAASVTAVNATQV